MTFFRDDLTYRWLNGTDRGIDATGMFTAVDVREVTGGEEFELGDLRVTTAGMTHTMFDVAYRFACSDRSIVVSGDTSFDERLIELAEDADVLVIDANPWADGSRPAPPRRPVDDLPPEYRTPTPYRGDPRAQNHMPRRLTSSM